MATTPEVSRRLDQLYRDKAWTELSVEAQAAALDDPHDANLCGYVAHAMRQLGQLEDGYTWATRGAQLEPTNLFVNNRVSLLANLTGRFAVAYDTARSQVEHVVASAQDAQNLAVMIVNGIYGASQLGKIAEAVDVFTPAIERLDHADLHYNSACLYALAGDERIYAYMAKSLATGRDKATFADGDFDTVRGDPRFARLLARDWVEEAGALARSAKASRAELVAEDFLDPAKLGATADDPAVDDERNAALEQAIDRDPDELAGYLVYSDWLQERGNPRGWLVLASQRCAEATSEDERMLAFVDWASQVHHHARRWLGAFAPHAAVNGSTRWRYGFVTELGFDLGYSRRRKLDAGALLAATLALPVCRFVRRLAIGDIPADDELSYEPIVDTLLRFDLPQLRALEIAPNKYQMSWTHLDATGLPEHFPRLESFVLGAGDLTTGTLVLPHLRRFAIRTGGLTRDNLAAICAARWPALEDLEIWFGGADDGADEFTARDLAPILSGRDQPRLRRLALRNAELADAICAALVGAPVLPHLSELDLSMGTMTDVGADVLIANAKWFAHLAKLSVADNALSDVAVVALRRALPNVETGTQKADRYVSVGE